MDDKISAILEKVSQERNKGNFEKAIKRLTEAIEKHREEIQLYSEAIDVSLESGESLQASQFFKKACAALPRQRDKLWSCVKEMVKNYNDPVLAKFLLEQATKRRDLESGREVLENLEDHTASDLLKRTRIKMQTLSSALRGGYTLKGELIINALSEALLCLRVGRIREAAKTFVRILDEKPVENEVLEPFFCRLEKSYPNEAAVRYALGCCHIVSERFEKAFAKFIQCARMNPAFGDDIMERLRSVKSRMDPTPDDLDATMAETLLLTEDILGASEIISSILEKRPGKAAFVLELLYPRLGKNTESLILDYLFIEAALLSKQSRKALEHIKAIYQKPAHKKDILDWLEKKSKECFLPPDVLIFYGETALAEKMIEKGIEILREAISASANDAPVILHILEKFKDQDQEIESFYREIADNAYASADPAELDIEHFGSDQFYNASLYSDSVKLDRDRSAKAPEKRAPSEPSLSEKSPSSFEQRYQAFCGGGLEEGEMLSLAEEAFGLGRMDEMKELLSFKAKGAPQETKRKLFLARYYLYKDMPLSALVTLRSIELGRLEGEERREILLKIATCYRALHIYEAAHAAFLKIMGDPPLPSNLEAIVRQNYSDYLHEVGGGARVLEKVSSIEQPKP